MDSNTGHSQEDGGDEIVELQQLLIELQQLTKQQSSYTTVLQSLHERQSAVNDRLLQIGATAENGQVWKKLKNMGLLERENQSLRQKVDEITNAKQVLDARLSDMKSKLAQSTISSKKLLESKQQMLKELDCVKKKLDSSKLEQEQMQAELDRLKASVEEFTSEKRCLLQRVKELTIDSEKVSFLQKETAELKGKIAGMERLQALRNLRELDDTSANEVINKVRLELIGKTTEANGENKYSGWQTLCLDVCQSMF